MFCRALACLRVKTCFALFFLSAIAPGMVGGRAHAQAQLNPDPAYVTYCGAAINAPRGGQNPVSIRYFPGITVDATGTYRGSSLVVPGGCYVDAGNSNVVITGLTEVQKGGVLIFNTQPQYNGNTATYQNPFSFHTGLLQVDAGGFVSADGDLLSPGPGLGSYPGTAPGYNNGAGGSYGGAGGALNPDSSTNTSYEYGQVAQPTFLGSGGYSQVANTCPSQGGGSIHLIVDTTLMLNGVIDSNGSEPFNYPHGAYGCYGPPQSPGPYGSGSGGSIWVTTQTLSGSGTFAADGGYYPGGGAGGGGRVWVESVDASQFTGLTSSTASTLVTQIGAPADGSTNGTIYFANTTTSPVGVTLPQTQAIPPNTTVTYSSLTLENGATLTIGGGSTINVTGALTVTGNSTIILQSLNTTAQVNGVWAGQGSVINAGSMQVDAGSNINADAQGYVQEAGPGAAAGPYATAGGSYGGGGGGLAGDPSIDVMTYQYGLANHPTDLGSGGWEYNSQGGTGGGMVQIAVSGATVMNGTISANGGTGQFNSAGGGSGGGGGGSGGGIYLTTGTLAGSGLFSAVGGGVTNSAGGGGGGGRIYVSDSAGSTFTGSNKATAVGGGAGTSRPGFPGTVAFVDTSADTGSNTGSRGALMVYEPYTIPVNTTATFDSITVMNGTTLTIGGGSTLTVNGAVSVTGNSQILLQSINNTAQVNGKWVGQGSTITAASVNVDAGSNINADGQGYVQEAGPGAAAGPYSTAGGSYGGLGGNLGGSSTPAALAAMYEYGSTTMPTDLGSGGWEYGSVGGAGGGAVQLLVSGTTTLNGTITANGAVGGYNSAGGGSGAGAGGSGGSVYLTTAILTGSGTFAANGGNAITAGGAGTGGGGRVAVYSSSRTGFSGNTTSTVSAGTGTPATGTIGTVAFFDTSTTTPSVATYQRFTFPASASVSYNNITAANGSTLVVGGGATVNASGTLLVTGNSTVQAQSINNTAQVNGAWAGQGSTFDAAMLQVDTGSTISADAQGYAIEQGPGAYIGAGSSTGGSYGGQGGRLNGGNTPDPSFEYGSQSAPVDLGSGGWQYGGTAGAGGGAIRLNVSGTVTLNGTVTANGAVANGDSGAGSGGSVELTAATLTGSGMFEANGGNAAGDGGAGGGGGRIAVYSPAMAGFTGAATSTVAGGTAPNYPGTQGTLAFFDTSAPNNNVSIYGGYNLPPNSTSTFNNLTVAQGGNLQLGGGSQLLVAQTLHVTGTITAQSINNTGLVNGQYAGKGISILANAAQIDAGGVITADSQGYVIEQGPGAEAGPYTAAGGSYGGVGGARDNAGTYGSATLPLDLGSGGWQYAGNAGAGGGAIELLVASGLTMNGTLTANGGGSTGDAGGGAGGSVFVAANTINGSGTISAVGGSNASNAGGGGGGGRVSVLYAAANSLPQASISVVGGTNSINGAAGTINLQQQAFSQFILPVQPAIHDTAQLEWFTDAGGTTAVSLAGPRTQQVATGAGAISTASFDTTAFPDGAYQLRLSVLDTSGKVVQVVTKDEVINNSVAWHCGTLTANQEWTTAKVNALDCNVIVPSGITLTIDPGAIVKALPGTSIIVQNGGTLNALGTASAAVIFTTFDDSSIGGNTDFNAGTSVPQAGEWQGIIVLGTGVYNSNGYTDVLYTQALLSGTLPGNESLLGTRVYTITGTLTVPSGVTLNIQPGAVVKFGEGAGIDVQQGGVLNASGTLAQPIYMTSLNDDSIGGNTSGNNGAILPVAGDWNTIEIDGGTATFNYAHLRYGGGPQNSSAQAGMIETGNNAQVTISNSELAYAFFIGLQTGYPNGGGDTVTVTNTVFHDNEDRAINTFNGSTVHVVNDTFDSNAAGVFNHGGTVDVENSVVTNSSSAQFGNIGVCCGSSFSKLSYNDAYTTVAGVANYAGLTDPTGTNGNISAAPVYMNGPQRDYRPTYGSPLIDAANGTVANYPVTDAFNDARYNAPLVAAKTGKPDANGNYPDIGAFEFVQSAPSDLDLTVSNVQGPKSAIVGQQVQVSWTVTNIGTGTVYGPWHDAVYLVADPNSNGVPVLAQTILEGQGIVLGPGASYQATATIAVPGTIVGMQQWQVRTNVLGEVFEGANTANNSANSIDTVAIDLQQILPGGNALTGTFAGDSQSAYFKIQPSASQTTQVQLALTGVAGNAVELFIGAGYVPTPQHYDYTQTQFDAASVSAVIPSGSAQTYYVTAYAEDLASAPAGFTISANALQFSLIGVTPGSVSNVGSQTLTFIGGGFTSLTVFSVTGPGGAVLQPTHVFVSDAAHASVTFDFTRAGTGAYSAQAANGNSLQMLANAIQVTTQSSGTSTPGVYPGSGVELNLDAPQAFRAGFPATVTLTYTNIASIDLTAPLISFSATNATLAEVAPACTTCGANYAQQYASTFNGGLLLGISSQGPAGVLPAGASNSLQFTVTPAATGTVSFVVAPVTADIIATQLDPDNSACPTIQQVTQDGYVNQCGYAEAQTGAYGSAADFCAALTAPGESAAGVSRACMQLLNDAGYSYVAPKVDPHFVSYYLNGPNAYVNGRLTAPQLSSLLASAATALSAQGTYEYDAQKLLVYTLNHEGYPQFRQTYHQGAFGYNFDLPFNISLTAVNNGLTELLPTGEARAFTLASTMPPTYIGSTGDYGILVQQADSSYLLTERDGRQYHFLASTSPVIGNRLDSVQAPNGYKVQVTQGFSAGGVPLIAAVSDSLGNRISYTYDNNNVVTQAADAQGRTASYTYNEVALPSGLRNIYLTGVTDATGNTVLTWQQAGKDGAGYIDDSCVLTFCEQPVAVTRAQFPDGTEADFTYDSAGRVTAVSGANGIQPTSETYNADGSTTSTDAVNSTMTYTHDFAGRITSTVNPAGVMTRFQLDPEGKPIRFLGGLGDSTLLSYDPAGNINSLTLPNSSYSSFSYGTNESLLSLTNPVGSAYTFGVDGNSNRTSVADPTASRVSYTYNALGQLLTRTNRRGQTTTYTYTSTGLLASMTLSTGAATTFSYDSHNNLLSSTTPSGTTSFTYDSADRLASVTNPDGTSLTYTYNAQGQRSSMKDSAGYTVQYSYDSLGRIAALADGAGRSIVAYGYDAAGHLISKTFGNGTSTSIAVNSNGDKNSIVNYSPSHAILSEYDYAYDADGNPISEKTPTGVFTYGYDLAKQLTSVTTPAATTINYTYDPNGNRTSVSSNGAAVAYAPNNLDQYTSVGTAAFRYDADGDLVSDGTYAYSYDELGELLTAASATDSWSFTYNTMGERMSATHNGVTTRYLNDPTGSGNVFATFSGSGALLSHYVFGNDLTSAVAADGTVSYYHLDLTGSTTQMTNSAGAVVNAYTYLPFGERTTLSASVSNPFTYAGSYGVLDDGFGPYFMRNRSYSPSLGRFLQQDPTSFSGGDTNLYRYVYNSPVGFVDPLGFGFLGDAYDTASHISNYAGVLTSGAASSANNIFGLYGTIQSLGDNVDNGDVLGSIHDFTVGGLSVAQTYLNHNVAATDALTSTLPGAALYLLIQSGSIIDQGSQDIFNNFFQSAYEQPSPLTCPSCGDNSAPVPGVPPIKLPIKVPQPSINVPVRGAIDPNGKLTSGFGDTGYVPAGVAITYTIFFENQSTATAPAQKVTVTDALPKNLDFSTVQLTQVAFNNATLNITGGVQTYKAQATVSSDPNPVAVSASLNPTTGVLTWTMQSVDPVTSGTPANPLAGFLPPNNSANAGVGSVTFTVKPLANQANGATVTNQASIVFDVNAAIATNTVSNQLDTTVPTSAVGPLSATSGSSFVVSWSGSDPAGSGIASYNIYVSDNGGAYMLWQSGTTATSATYTGVVGHSYSFVSLATNNVGTVQTTPGTAATTTVGTGSGGAVTVAVVPASSSITQSQPLSVKVTVTGSGTPTGSVVLASGSYTSAATPLVSGAATIVIPANGLAVGSDTLTATYTPDAAGASSYGTGTGSATVQVQAGVSTLQVTVGALPAAASFSVDGTAYTSTQTFTWTLGSSHALATASPQTAAGVQQTFTAWSDGGALTHSVTATTGVSSYSATFATAYLLTTAASPTTGGAVTPASGTYYPAGTVVPVAATPAAGYTFGSWTGPVANATSAKTTVTMTAPETVMANFGLTPAATVTLSPGTLSFSSLPGLATSAQSVTLSNNSMAALAISGLSITGSGASSFAQTNTCGASLAVGAKCTINVVFTPSAVASYSATLNLTSSYSGTAPTVALTGAGTTFTLSVAPISVTAKSGTSPTFTVTVAAQGGSENTPVTLTVAGVPASAQAVFLPSSVTPGSSSAQSVLTIRLPSPTVMLRGSPLEREGAPVLALCGLVFLAFGRRRRLVSLALMAVLCLFAASYLTGCGHDTDTTYNLTISGTAGTQTVTTTAQLIVRN